MTARELNDRLDRYLVLRRALGFPMRQQERLLRDFVSFVSSRCSASGAFADAAVAWAASTSQSCRPGGAADRLSVARGLLTYLHALDQQVAVPPAHLLPGPRRPMPHIYSPSELEALMRAAQGLGPKDSLRPHTMATLIGLLFSCGMRVREAIRLSLDDVDLSGTPPTLLIRQTKFRKTRIVPMHDSTAAALGRYAQTRHRLGYDGLCDSFFVSERAGPLVYNSVADTFRTLTLRLGLRGVSGQRDARLHDLRHTFAVTRMLAWYREGADVQARLPELSVYLGHVRPEDTYWYLTATPALLEAAAVRFERFTADGGSP